MITLKTRENSGTELNKDSFNINIEQEKKSCARKMIDLASQGYYTPTEWPATVRNRNLGYNDIQYLEQPGERVVITNIPVAINTISRYLAQESANKTIVFEPTNSNVNRVEGNINNISTWGGGGNKKQYIKLQSGGKRLIRYGKRGGKYYMKGGKKHYIK